MHCCTCICRWWVGMDESRASSATAKIHQLRLRHVSLVIPCSELALWAVLMHEVDPAARYADSAPATNDSSNWTVTASGSCLLAKGSSNRSSLLLQRLQSFAAASQLMPGQLLTGNSRDSLSFNRRLSFRRLVHWGWSGQWVTLTCDAPASLPQAMKDELQAQLDTAWGYGKCSCILAAYH